MNPKREINKLEQGRWWCSDAPGPGGRSHQGRLQSAL